MERRQFLVGSGSVLATTVAGCLDVVSGDEPEHGEDHTSAPVIVDGIAYYGREDGYVYAVDLYARQERWRFDAGSPITLSVARDDDNIFAATDAGLVCAIDMQTGDEIWTVESSPSMLGVDMLFSPVVADDVVYFGNNDGRFYAVEAASGDVEWVFETDWWPFFWRQSVSFSCAVEDDRVYVSGGHHLYEIDTTTSEERRRFDTDGFASPPATGDGTVCVGGKRRLYALDLDTWDERWSVDIGGTIRFPVVIGGTVYAPNDDGTLSAVDLASGEVQWRFETGGGFHTPPVFSDANVFFGSHDGYIYGLDRTTGEKRWRYRVGEGATFAGVAATPTVVDDRVYVGAPGHTLVAVDADTGDEQMRFAHA